MTKSCVLAFLVASPSAVANAGTLSYAGKFGTTDVSVANLAQPGGVRLVPSADNPIINGNNLYAPDVVKSGNVWDIYYGGWKDSNQTHDQIYFAYSDDIAPEGLWSGQNVLIDHGAYFHVNDPSVAHVAGSNYWVMAYTVADTRDWIAFSQSYNNRASWSPSTAGGTEATFTNMTFQRVARPSLVWTGSVWRMWFDADTGGGLHSYVAESSDVFPHQFTVLKQYPDVNGAFPGFMEPDVEMINGKYIAVVQRGYTDLYKYESIDGINFTEIAHIISAETAGAGYIDNPSLLYDTGANKLDGVSFGMTNDSGLTHHGVGFAYFQLELMVKSCPSTWHIYTVGRYLDQATQLTYGYGSFCEFLIVDPVTNATLLDAHIQSSAGDIWVYNP